MKPQDATHQAPIPEEPPTDLLDIVSRTIEERGKIYGDPYGGHTNIGKAWTALLQQHYGVEFDHDIPAEIVALMMVVFKAQRSAQVFHADNYVDGHAYLRFAEEFQSESSRQP